LSGGESFYKKAQLSRFHFVRVYEVVDDDLSFGAYQNL
jgi:hypothetical protein